MGKVGPKEQQIADLRKRKALPPHVDIMLADGCPPDLIILPGERPSRKRVSKPTADAGVTLAPPLAIQKAIAADLAGDDGKAPSEKQESEPMRTKSTKKPASARKAVTGKTSAAKKSDGKSKVDIIAGLLKRQNGCTTKDVLAATGWPSVSMPQQAKAAGISLKKEKKDGVTRYYAA